MIPSQIAMWWLVHLITTVHNSKSHDHLSACKSPILALLTSNRVVDLNTHLWFLRDPRAVIHSRARTASFKLLTKGKERLASTLLCDRLKKDLDSLVHLSHLYPGRVKILRYEDGATHPQIYTADIYRFLGLELTVDVREYVSFLTSGGDDSAFGVRRSDPTSTMQAWRYSMLYEHVTLVDELCGHLYPSLGYRMVESKTDLISNRTVVLEKSLTF